MLRTNLRTFLETLLRKVCLVVFVVTLVVVDVVVEVGLLILLIRLRLLSTVSSGFGKGRIGHRCRGIEVRLDFVVVVVVAVEIIKIFHLWRSNIALELLVALEISVVKAVLIKLAPFNVVNVSVVYF